MTTRAPFLRFALVALALVALLAPGAAFAKKKHKRHAAKKENSPLIIGHRGAAGYLPDHTLEGYRLAIKLGADYIEPDLVSTKDGVLIARHEPNIAATTNVADHPEFASREKTISIDGGDPETGWFTWDFTLAEIKTLRAKQPRTPRPTEFDGKFAIPTFQEVIDLVKRESRRRGRRIGIYPETKHPTEHQRRNLALEGRLVRALKKNGLNNRNSPVFIQSFEQSNLKQLNHMTPVRLVQLVDANDTDPVTGNPTYKRPFDRPYDWTVSNDPNLTSRTFGFFATDEGLAEIKTYADGIGPWKVYIVPITGGPNGGAVMPPTDLIKRAHEHGLLLIHTWTFRDDSYPSGYTGGPVQEYLKFFNLGIDGVFTDFTATAIAAREIFRGP
jgi:glycerophosphoryl diester phosphodiesterase